MELTILLWNHNNDRFEVPFVVMTVPPLTPENQKMFVSGDPVYGNWSCTSPYLGKGYFGKYYIKNLPRQTCSVEQTWADECTHGLNPFAFFFDVDATNPFLVLHAFTPASNNREEYGEIRMMYVEGVQAALRWVVKR